MRLGVVLLFLLAWTPAWATYDDATVVQIDPVTPQGTVSITASFTGAGEPTMKVSVVMPWDFTQAQLNDWAASVTERLNGTKVLSSKAKIGDKLTVTRPAKQAEGVSTP